MNIESLARLTASSKPIREKLDSSFNHLPIEILAPALPTNRFRRALIMAAYMLDYAAMREAGYLLHVKSPDIIKLRPIRGVEIEKAMSFLAVKEITIEEKEVCPECSGSEWQWDTENNRPFKCSSCDLGHVRKRLTMVERYRRLLNLCVPGVVFSGLAAITTDDWSNKWRYAYDKLYSWALNEHHVAVQEVHDRL